METEGRREVVQGLEERGMETYCLISSGFLFGMMKGSGDGQW